MGMVMDSNDQHDSIDDSMDESESGIMMSRRVRLIASLTTIEAHIIHDALAGVGIKSRIRRKFASAAMSLQPISGVELWVFPTDYEAAKEVVSTLQAVETEPVSCEACGELSPGHFNVCWNCGATLGAADATGEAAEAPAKD
jgi:hypothetical protein